MAVLPSTETRFPDGTQAFLVRSYLQRIRRRPPVRRHLEPRPAPEPGAPSDPSVAPGGPRSMVSWASPDLAGRVRRYAGTTPLLSRSLHVPPAASRPPATLQRAMAFIEARATEPIGLTEIAQAGQVSPRALQAAFRRYLGTTPLAHLRAVRMARAHADLRAARAGDGQTVSAIASRWGFTQLSRFAADHKQRYGESPRQTLGRDER